MTIGCFNLSLKDIGNGWEKVEIGRFTVGHLVLKILFKILQYGIIVSSLSHEILPGYL